MTFTLYGYDNNPRSQIIMVAAALEGIPIEMSVVIPRKNVGTQEYVAKFPLSRGKVPALEGPGVKLTEVIAISTYIASLAPGAKLLGDGSKEQSAEVLSWLSWTNQELLQTLALWFLPLIPGMTRPAPYDYQAVEDGKAATLEMLARVESLVGSAKFLVGDHLTLADIFLTVYLGRGFEWVLDAQWRAAHPNIMAFFNHKVALDCFKKALPPFKLIEEQTPNKNPYA